jgi:LmbE family N-acetylglucosaminyl deacetylase
VTAVVVSPHLDDALLSMGGWLAWHPGALVVTLFAGSPHERVPLSGWDRKCGFETGREAMLARRIEDRRAATMLAARTIHLPLLDGQYRNTVPYDEGVLDAALVGALHDVAPSIVFVPLGIGHDDHIAAGRACRRVFAGAPYSVIVYEEIPYRVDMPAEAVHTLDSLDVEWWQEAPPDARLAAEGKRRACSRYASQIWAIPPWALDVPERMWRIVNRDAELALEEADDGEA